MQKNYNGYFFHQQVYYSMFRKIGGILMKKVLRMMLSLMLVLNLVGCGDTTSDDKEAKEEIKEETKEEVQEVKFEEVVVVDNEECKVVITEIEPDHLFGYTLHTTLENKSKEKTYMYTLESASINGVQSETIFASEVAPGKKANEDICFMDETLKEAIKDYSDIYLTFKVYDSNDWSADPVAYESVHVYPYGKEKATTYVREPQDSDQVLIDNEYATVVVTGYEQNDIWGYQIHLYVTNKTDTTAMFSADNLSINGYMLDALAAESVIPHTSAFTTISCFNDELEKNKITEVEDIEFTLRIYNYDDIFAGDYVKEVITLKP